MNSKRSWHGLALVALVPLLIFPVGAPASAHAQRLVSTPAVGAVLYKWPALASVTFDDDIVAMPDANQLVVTDPKRHRVDTGAFVVKGATLTVALKKTKLYGKYTVTYRVISADGHPVSESYPFYFKKKKK